MRIMTFRSIQFNTERKVILIGGIILLLAGAVYRYYPTIHSTVSIADEVELKQNHMGKYLKVAERRKQADRINKNVVKQFKQLEAELLEGSTTSLAAVEIQNIINDIVEISSLEVDTMRVMNPEEAEKQDYIRIPVRFSVKSNIVQLKEILYKIESSSKLLIITELDAEIVRSKEQKEIRSSIVVEGVMRRPVVSD